MIDAFRNSVLYSYWSEQCSPLLLIGTVFSTLIDRNSVLHSYWIFYPFSLVPAANPNEIFNYIMQPQLTKLVMPLLLCLLLLAGPALAIRPTQPIRANPNTESSPANFFFFFQLDNALPASGYLMITFSPYITSAEPLTCDMLTDTGNPITSCVNLNTAGESITISQSGINGVNPNIDATKTVVMQFSSGLAAGQEFKIQITTNNVLPDIGSITTSFEMYTVTGTGVMIEQNWNCGQVFLEPKQNKLLNVLNRNDMTMNLPGQSFTNLLFDITIGVNCPTPVSRLKFVIEGGFTFSDSSLVTTLSLLGAAPVIAQSLIESPNVIITTFSEAFIIGRKFSLRIADIRNPLSILDGYISVYHLPYNSLSPLEISEQSIPIETVPYLPSITLLTIDGTTPVAPIQYYTGNVQYIMMKIVVDRDIDPEFVIQVESDTLVIHEGSVFATTSTVTADTVVYGHYSSNGVRISGFPLIPQSSTITLTMRVEIGSASIFTMTVSIDELANIGNPIILGTVSSNSAAVPETYLTSLTGAQGELNKLDAMQNSDSLISFTVTPNFLTNAGSFLRIITSKSLVASSNFLPASSCTIAGNPEACTLSSNSTFTTITIASNSSYNLFPQSTATTVVISNLKFLFSSSHSQNIYHFYFSLTVSEAFSAASKNLLRVPLVIPERSQLTSFSNHFVNDLNNSGTNFPNIFRLLSTDTAQWDDVVQSYERRIISVFAYQGWTNLFTSLSSGDPYPGKSNVPGFTFTYRQGTQSNLDDQFPLDWDSVDIVLDNSETTTDFSIILPTTFLASSALQFEIMVGVKNIETRVVRYLNIEPRPTTGNPTYLQAASASLSSKAKVLTNKIQLAGWAGSYKDNVSITITPGNPPYSGSSSSAALMIVSDWQFFDDSSTYSTTQVSANPSVGDTEQSPMWIYLSETEKFLTYMPLATSSDVSVGFNITLDSIKLPYGDDLPYYSIYLVDSTGTIDSYNELINQDKGVFYSRHLKTLNFSCNVISLGVLNTYCTLTFTPNNQLEVLSRMVVYFTGMQVSTDMCSMEDSTTGIPVSVDCQSNTDKNQLGLTINNAEGRLDEHRLYSVKIYGVSILTETIMHWVEVELRDPANSYVIEWGKRILLTSVADFQPVYITEVSYSKNNPIVASYFQVKFTLPRQLNSDESFAIVMSKDLANLNTLEAKLNIKLLDGAGVQIPAVWSLNLKYYQILFEGLQEELSAGNFTVQIYGIITPSSIEQDLLSIIYLRNYDLSYTAFNNEQSTQQFPTLADKVNSQIIMQPYFNTEGLEQQLTFTIVNQYAVVDASTQWLLSLPRYYSQRIWNEDYLIYCTIQDSPIDCHQDPHTPYQLLIYNSPQLIPINDTYILNVYGIPCPRAAYLNGNADYVTESVFMGIAASSSADSYTEYSDLFVVESIVNPETAGYGSIVLTGIVSSNMEVLQTTFFTVSCTSSIAIPTQSWLYLTFPEEFDNFHDLPLSVEVVQSTNTRTYTSEVVNRRVGFQLASGLALSASTTFQLLISSLPTPSSPVSIDMNKLRVMVATSDRLGTIAASLQLHNQVGEMEFVPTDLHIVINNYQTIVVTAGTYSLPVKIQPSDFSTFVSNMQITFVSNAITFKESPTNLFLGQEHSTFSIGADQNLIPTLYAFDIIKSESSIQAYYSSLSKYTVLVTNTPVQIDIPANVQIPQGGCSVPYQVELDNLPYSDININFEYDTTLYDLHLLWLNEQISFNELQFDGSITKRWLSFCADPSLSVGSIDVGLFLGGTNKLSYSLSTSNIVVDVIANATTDVPPTFTLESKNLQKTYAGFDVTANMPGQIFYELKLAPLSAPLSLLDLKTSVKEYQLTLESSSDYLNNIYEGERDHRVGMLTGVAGVNALQFEDMLPGQSYTLCVTLENQHRQAAGQQCQTFSMMEWGIVSKATITFSNGPLYRSQLNKVLCFFVKASESEILQVVDLSGHSCSLSSVPENYNYLYTGQTTSSELTQTTIYFLTNRNLTTDPSVTLFSNAYDSDGITAASLSLALSSFAINYIDTSDLQSTFDSNDARSPTSDFQPSLSTGDPVFSSAASTLTIDGIRLSKPGSVYLVLTFNKKITYNEITGATQIDIRTAITPTHSQILNCLDGYGQQPLSCNRVVLMPGESQSVTFANIEGDSMYVLYYGVAGEYPMRPIMVGAVKNITIVTTAEKILALALLSVLALFLL